MPEEPLPPQKPIPSKKWGLIVLACVIGLLVLLNLVTGIQRTAPRRSSSTQTTQPMDAKALQGFDSETKQMTQDLQHQREALQTAIERAGKVDLSHLSEPVPDCNQAMREKLGGRSLATGSPDGSIVRLACEPNNQWVVIPEAAATIQPLTPQQQQALRNTPSYGGATSGISRAEQRKQEAQKRREEALNSSSVALDFAGQPNRSAENSRPVETSPSVHPTLRDVSEKSTEDRAKYPWDAFTGQLYRVFEGTVFETVLTNRLNGEFTGPVNVMVTTDLYSHDHQHILMPQGTRILGEALKVSAQQERRLAVVFHRAIMPDGYSVDFDKFAGLDQQGASGLTGKVNTHWAKVIGTAVLVGAIGGLSQIGSYGGGYGPGVAIETGIGSQSSQQAVQILDRALNVLPNVTVYEGTRVRIWVQKDAELPAYENHAITPAL